MVPLLVEHYNSQKLISWTLHHDANSSWFRYISRRVESERINSHHILLFGTELPYGTKSLFFLVFKRAISHPWSVEISNIPRLGRHGNYKGTLDTQGFVRTYSWWMKPLERKLTICQCVTELQFREDLWASWRNWKGRLRSEPRTTLKLSGTPSRPRLRDALTNSAGYL